MNYDRSMYGRNLDSDLDRERKVAVNILESSKRQIYGSKGGSLLSEFFSGPEQPPSQSKLSD